LGWLKACEIREHFDNMSRSLDWMDECGMLEITLPGHPISYMIYDIRYHEARAHVQFSTVFDIGELFAKKKNPLRR